jgi:two-component system response regulator MprA
VDRQYHAYVLVVDDDPDIRVLLSDLLATEGYAVLTAPDGLAALDLATLYPPSLILMDLRMPIMDGWMCIRSIRERSIATPIIVTSEPEAAGRLDGLSDVEYLAKPFFIKDLLALVEDLSGSLKAGL